MGRISRFELVVDTGHFTPLQLQPRALLSIAFNGMSVWLREHLVSFPELIQEHRCSVVILGVDLDYQTPLRFFDSPTLDVRCSMHALRGATRLELDVRFEAKARCAATVRILLCPVRILDPVSLGAAPEKLPGHLLEKLLPEEILPGSPQRTLPELRRDIEERGEALASFSSPFVLHRHLCEVADQWAFYEVPGLVGASREALVLERGGDIPALRAALGSPMRQLKIELNRPYFWSQPGKVETTAYRHDGQLALIHRLLSPVPGDESHGVVIEKF